MTLHTKAAASDILDIFNQPLGDIDLMAAQPESAGESDYEDDDYTSAGESTGTGRISGRSEFGDDDTEARHSINHEDTEVASVSPWSDFTASKHVPKLHSLNSSTEDGDCDEVEVEAQDYVVVDRTNRSHPDSEDDVDIITPISPVCTDETYRSRFVPIPPENYQAPNGPYRDPSQAIHNRLPFMTPIVEKTESSIGAMTIKDDFDSFSSKTPSRWEGDFPEILETDEMMSPIQAIQGSVGEGEPSYPKIQSPPELNRASSKTAPLSQKAILEARSGSIIKDRQCNPTDETIRKTILDNLEPPLSSHASFFDHRPLTFSKSGEIRKFVKSLTKASKGSAEKTSLSLSPSLKFPDPCNNTYTVKRELGKGAFAPVYLIQEEERPEDESKPASPKRWALKCEHPPNPWEFYIMTTVHARLASAIPNAHPSLERSLLRPHALHLFADEGYLLEEYLDQGTLLNVVNLAKADPSGVLDETIAMFFTVELLRTIEAMHCLGILHGDLKADNCLVRLSPSSFSSSSSSSSEQWSAEYSASGSGGWFHKGLCLIDFGRAIDLHQFLPHVGFIADWKTDSADCPEMRALRPWTWQVDYWGIACIAHSLLYGKYLEAIPVVSSYSTSATTSNTSAYSDNNGMINMNNNNFTTNITNHQSQSQRRWKLKEPLKRYWQTEIWQGLFDACMNPVMTAAVVEMQEEGGVMPLKKTLKKVREGMEDWLEREGGKRGLKSGLRRLEERVKR